MTPRASADRYQCVAGIPCPHFIVLVYQTTRRHVSGQRIFHKYSRANFEPLIVRYACYYHRLKSYYLLCSVFRYCQSNVDYSRVLF